VSTLHTPSVSQATAQSIVAGVIYDHFAMESNLHAYDNYDERSDYAQEWMSYEDYRDATEGRCGFSWDSDPEEPEAIVEAVETKWKNHLATIAIQMVYAMTGDDWDEPTDWQEWLPFLTKCVGEKRAKEFLGWSICADGTWSLY
jgi:hypothetical protein